MLQQHLFTLAIHIPPGRGLHEITGHAV